MVIIKYNEYIYNKITLIQMIHHTKPSINVECGETITLVNIQEIIRNTIIALQYYKKNELITENELITCMKRLEQIYVNGKLDDLLHIITEYGTYKFKDILALYGESLPYESMYENIYHYFHPTGLQIISYKPKKNESKIECFPYNKSSTNTLYHTVYGIQLIVKNEKKKKQYMIDGIIDDVPISFIENKWIEQRKYEIIKTPKIEKRDIIQHMVEFLSLRDLLLLNNDDIYQKYTSIIMKINTLKTMTTDDIVQFFHEMDMVSQRELFVQLLTYHKEETIQYMIYILFHLIRPAEEKVIYETFTWNMKVYLKEILQNMNEIGGEQIPLSMENKISLLKVPDSVKEKAFAKLKEIKGKPDDMKAKQYLDGLLKIPFGHIRQEPILKNSKTINTFFQEIRYLNKQCIVKPKYTNMEIIQYTETIEQYINENMIHYIDKKMRCLNKPQLTTILRHMGSVGTGNKKKDKMEYIRMMYCTMNNQMIYDLYKYIYDICGDTPEIISTRNKIGFIREKIAHIETNMNHIMEELDHSVYAHENAKNQILKIISQWISGEQTGYCFGFEGSPGIGKTSLAKNGLSKCLKDEYGVSRPFSFITIGGSCNGSLLEGHGYTYVNSTWGRIVDILMETKCMNPIIYIDELDKVSKTEQGKEIIGILTHMIDSTQNNVFQDKYFSGIDIDLSKVLFVFSYNNPENIDSVLLDRIHRIQFDNLSLYDKIVIVEKYIIPDINKKMGFYDIVVLPQNVIKHIIMKYTQEPGVRKLKEILFDLFGEINIELLTFKEKTFELPIVITEELLGTKYLKKYRKNMEKRISSENKIGIINGLWANSLGLGGIIKIETSFFPSSHFLELKLTGLQGDVMKESMNVAKTLAWNYTDLEKKKKWIQYMEESKNQGLHIHCPEGSVSKDGPSAGAAITIAIYSLLNDKKIRRDIAITGEIDLCGEISAIGGLEYKILGGLESGITTFLYPTKNQNELEHFLQKYEDKISIEHIQFIPITTVQDTFPHVFIE